MQRTPSRQGPKGHDNLISTFNIAIEGFNLAKEILSVTPAKAAFGSVSVILALIRDSMINEEDYIQLGIDCAGACIAISRAMNGKSLGDLDEPASGAVVQLTDTVTKIERDVIKKLKRRRFLKLFHAKADTQTINTWRTALIKIMTVFNAELALNTHNVIAEMAKDLKEMKLRDATRDSENNKSQSQAPPGEDPPPPPRKCVGRDPLIEELVCRAERLGPSALIGAGGTGKTAIALTVLHHPRIVQKFSDRRRFIRCDEFPTSLVNFLDRLSVVIGAGVKNVTSLAPLRRFITAQPMILIIDNGETLLDQHAQDASAIYLVIEELSQFPELCLIITSRLSAVPSDCKRMDVPPLSLEASREIFCRIHPEGERSDLIDGLLERLDFHPLSITILATVASRKSWDCRRILREWEKKKVEVLQAGHKSQNLAATIEVSLDSPTFKELGPQAREVLGVVAFFPQGINGEQLDWLFPEVPDRDNMVDTFCMLSLTSRYKGFITMLAPLREYLCPRDRKPPSLIWNVRTQYFSRLHLVDENLKPGMPGFEKTEWIVREESNVEHLLEEFAILDEGSEDVWEAYADFLLHLSWHKHPAREQTKFVGSFAKRMLDPLSHNPLGQKVINRFDKVLSDGTISGNETRRCLHVLGRMCELQRTLPESMHIELTVDPDGYRYSQGFSDVFRSEYEGRIVAIKVLRISATSDLQRVTSKFCREAVIWKHLSHPNIVPLFGVNFEGRWFSMITKWTVGRDINKYLKYYAWPRVANPILLLADAANGLKYMHNLNLVHGAMKGANVLVDDDDGPRACLTDFSLCTGGGAGNHPIDNNSSTSVDSMQLLSRTGTCGITPWMSPELFHEESQPTKESDCYALGMVVYEVLCGRYPFEDYDRRSPLLVMWAVTNGIRPQKPNAGESLGFTDELWRMVEGCWRENVDERPNVEEILRCLERAVPAWDARPPAPDPVEMPDRGDSPVSFSSFRD